MNVSRFVGRICLLGLAASSGIAGRLTEVWNFQTKTVSASAALKGVYGLAFSHDGQRIAAVIGDSTKLQSLIVLSVRDGAFVRIEGDPSFWDYGPQPSRQILWSPSDERILLVGAGSRSVIRLSDGRRCSPRATRFISDSRLVGYEYNPPRLSVFGPDCQALGRWDGFSADQELAEVFDTSPDRGLLFVTLNTVVKKQSHVTVPAAKSTAARKSFDWITTTVTSAEQLVIADGSRAVVQRLSPPRFPVGFPPGLSSVQFADSGQALCGKNTRLECISADSGQALGSTEVDRFAKFHAAEKSSRVVITDYWKKLSWVDFFWYPGSVRRRTIWDFRSGKVVARWGSGMEDLTMPRSPVVSESKVSQPRPFDISPDGGYIVEGDAGVITLYKVQD